MVFFKEFYLILEIFGFGFWMLGSRDIFLGSVRGQGTISRSHPPWVLGPLIHHYQEHFKRVVKTQISNLWRDLQFFKLFFLLFLIQRNMEDKWKAFVKILKEIQTDSRVDPLDLLEDISNCRPKLDRMTIWQVWSKIK